MVTIRVSSSIRVGVRVMIKVRVKIMLFRCCNCG